MLDPNEWTLAFAVAVVPREHFYGSRRNLVLDGDDGRHIQVPVLMLNGPGEPGTITEPLSIGAMENQARAYMENVFAAAESMEPPRNFYRSERVATATVAVDGEAEAARERDRAMIDRVRQLRDPGQVAGERIAADTSRSYVAALRRERAEARANGEPTVIEVWVD